MIRTIMLSVGRNFAEAGFIEEDKDIFYLTIGEIRGYINGETLELKKIIADKKDEYELYYKLPAFSRLVFAGKEFNKTHRNVNDTTVSRNIDKIFGTPCSNGIAEGEVVVINNASEAVDIKDKIIVTKTTDPGWVFLLMMSKGLIVEKGSLLSHTAIIARELKVPSIVAVNNATTILQSGDNVVMNANTGEIKKV